MKLSNHQIKLFQLFSIATSSIWSLTGILIMASIFNRLSGIAINITMGIVFNLIAFYLYLKSKNFLKVFSLFGSIELKNLNQLKLYFFLELIFTLMAFLIGLLFLTAVLSRVVFEKLSVFG